MPQAIIGGLAYFGSLLVPAAGFWMSVAVGATVLGVVGYQVKRAIGIKDNRGGKSISSHQQAVRGVVEPRKIVYGEALISGPIWFIKSAGSELRSLYTAIALTGHEVASFQGVWLDDKYVPWADVDDLAGGGDGGVDADTNSHGYGPLSDGAHVLYLREHLGTSGQTADSMLVSAFASDITSNHRLRGCSHIVVRAEKLEGADPVWQRGFPANVAVVVRGKKVYDPRLDSTFTGTWGTGSGAHRVATPSTWAWSRNPALCTADYLLDTDLGCAIAAARIDYNSVALAADVCDASVDIPGPSTEARWQCDGVLSCADTHRANLGKLLSSFDGLLRFVGGLYTISTGSQSVAMALTESHLIGPLQFQRQPEGDERYNGIRGTYFDPERRHKESQYLTVENTALQSSRDGGEAIFKDLDLPMTRGEYNAQRLAVRAANKADLTGMLVFPTGYNGLDLVPGDIITVTHAILSWVAKRFKVLALRHVDLVGVEIVAQEDSTAAYADPDVGDYGVRSASGTIDFPTILPDLPYQSDGVVKDPHFQRSTELWNGSDPDESRGYAWSGGAVSPATVEIVRTGGVTGGVVKMVLPSTGEGASITAIPSAQFSTFITGENFRTNIRIRKTTATTTLSAGLFRVRLRSTDFKFETLSEYSTVFDIPYADINSWTVNQWQEYEGTAVPGQRAKSSTQLPFVVPEFLATSQNAAVTLEIDAFNTARIAT